MEYYIINSIFAPARNCIHHPVPVLHRRCKPRKIFKLRQQSFSDSLTYQLRSIKKKNFSVMDRLWQSRLSTVLIYFKIISLWMCSCIS